MKTFIIFALLCCCYGAEQHDAITEIPQHIKAEDEQALTIPQKLPDDANKTKPQHIPENVKQDMNKEEKQFVVPVVVTPLATLPTFVTDKIKKLQDHVKLIMHQAETHIPQVINHQIAYKKQLKDQQNIVQGVEQKIKGPVEIPNKIKDVVQQIHQHVPQVISHHKNSQKTARSIKEDVQVPEDVKDIVNQVNHHIPLVINQHLANQENLAQVQEKYEEVKPVIPAHIQGIVDQVLQHIPQVLNHHHTQKTKVEDNVSQHVSQVVNTHVVLNKDPKDPTDIKSIVTQFHKQQVSPVRIVPQVPQHIKDVVSQVSQHVPQVINHHNAIKNEKEEKSTN